MKINKMKSIAVISLGAILGGLLVMTGIARQASVWADFHDAEN